MSDQNGNERRRIVITGMGAITPCGLDVDETWKNVREGNSGVSCVDGFEGAIRVAGMVQGFDPLEYIDRRTARRTDRFVHFALAAARHAIDSAGIDIAADADRIGCSVGTGIGGLKTEEVAHHKLFEAGPDRLNPYWVTALIPNMGAAEISMMYGTRGPLTTECTACAASAMSVGNAVMYIRAGMADAMLAGGVEAPVVPLGLGGFGTMRALSRRNDDPEGACRPLMPGSRRLRARRGRSGAGAGGTGPSAAARRHHPCRGAGIRHVVGCPPPDRARSGRGEPRPGDAERDGGRRGDGRTRSATSTPMRTSTPVSDAAETRAYQAQRLLGEDRARARADLVRPRARPATCWAPPAPWRRS